VLTTPQHNNDMTKTKPKLKKVIYKYSKTAIKKIAELLKEDDSLEVNQYFFPDVSWLQVERPGKFKTLDKKVLLQVSSQKIKKIPILVEYASYYPADFLKAAERGVGINFIKWLNPETNRFK
jgi:hypothetical protein